MIGRQKIPCYVLIFDQFEIIKKTLDFLTKYNNILEIVVIENPSANSAQIKEYVTGLGSQGLISRYYIFQENITGRALEVAINNELNKVRNSKYLLMTDGDLTVEDSNWLKEEINILKKNKEVFACGVSLDRSNLPIKSFPEAVDWVPKDLSEQAEYFEAYTGAHLLLMRGVEFAAFMDWNNENKPNFVDSTMHYYSKDIRHQKWARTKKAVAYHLTWDLYNDKNNSYTKLKTSKKHEETWHHNRKSPYELLSF